MGTIDPKKRRGQFRRRDLSGFNSQVIGLLRELGIISPKRSTPKPVHFPVQTRSKE